MTEQGKEIVAAPAGGEVLSAEEMMRDLALPRMSVGLQILMDDRKFAAIERIAGKLAQAVGVVPEHLIGQPEICFAIVQQSIQWNLNPFAVAAATYKPSKQSPKLAYEGKLVHAILEASGFFDDQGIRYEHFGDWSVLVGRWTMATSQSGGQYAKPSWGPNDAKGLGVRVRATLRRTGVDKVHEVQLTQCFPLNSTLWATRPEQQICYLAARAFANVVVPHIFMGVPFDAQLEDDGEAEMRDVSPVPAARPRAAATTLADVVTKHREGRGQTVEAEAGEAAPAGEAVAQEASSVAAEPEDVAQQQATDGEPAAEAGPGPDMVDLKMPGNPRTLNMERALATKQLLSSCSTAPNGAFVGQAMQINPWIDAETKDKLEQIQKAKGPGARRAGRGVGDQTGSLPV